MVMSPLANSPPNSTPEPEMGSLPQDAAIVPHSATPQVLTGNNNTVIFNLHAFLSKDMKAMNNYAIVPS